VKKSKSIIFLFLLALSFFLAKPSQVFAENCGAQDFIDTEGRWGTAGKAYTTGCYAINVGGNTTYQGNWDCGPGRQCFVFEKQEAACGSQTYFGKPTYCSVSALGRTLVPYSCPRSGEFCVIDNTGPIQGVCGKDTYQNKQTSCSVSALNRVIVPAYSGCNNGEFCVIDLGGSGGVCGKDKFQNRPTYCSVSASNRTIVNYSGCRSVGELCVTDLISSEQKPASLCTTLHDEPSRIQCNNCFQQNGAWTAIGCIPTDPSVFIGKLLLIGIGIAGGIAFLLILFGGFQIMTSAGNPEQLNAGRELISSAIAGLLLIIFSVFILKVIGVNILGIPGFG